MANYAHPQQQQQYQAAGRPSQRRQQPQQPQQYQGYENHYDQQYHDYDYNQQGQEQWDNAHYDQQGGWGNAQQYDGYQDMNASYRQAPPQQGRRQPPPQQQQQQQQQYYQDETYNDPYYQQSPPQSQGRWPPPQNQRVQQQAYNEPPQQRQDTRSRGAGRGDGPPQQGRGGMRPPGLDRSLLSMPVPKSLPQDNPFPTFPSQKPKQGAQKPGLEQSMAQMNINDNGSQAATGGPAGRGQPMPQQNRGMPQARPGTNPRQDSGNFEGQSQRQLSNRMPTGQRPPPTNVDTSRGNPPHRTSDPMSPSQRVFGPSTQRSVTMPQSLPNGGPAGAYDGYQDFADPSAAPGYYGPVSPTYVPPRPSTAGGVRQNGPQMQHGQRPPMPPMPSQQQPRPQQQYPPQNQQQAPIQHQQSQNNEQQGLNNFYDNYYEDSDRKSLNSTIDMPNFDAIPETNNKHRRGDSIDNHLSPTHDQSAYGPPAAAGNTGPNSAFQSQMLRSRSQPDLNGQYSNGVHQVAGDAPPMPVLPRANTGFAGQNGLPNGLPNGPRGRGPPQRGMTTDGMPRGPPNQGPMHGQPPAFDPRYGHHPPGFQRGYSDDSAYSEPPRNTRNFAPPMGPGNPIQRPGTAAPAPGRIPGDPMGRAPVNSDALPAHPMPIRPGLMQQGQQQSSQIPAPQTARPPPVRQYNSEPGRTSYEIQASSTQRNSAQSVVSHPVTYDELNRLRNTWKKSNQADIATGMTLVKKLVEASNVLADEGGTADARTKNKNREKFIQEAHKTIKKLVSAGSPDAMFYLADCYGQGLLGLQVDTKEAFTLYQSAAKGGHAASAYRTAVCCEMGHEEGGGTKKDPVKAVQWYRRAATLGDTPAMYKMGMILLKGLLGQQKNVGEAISMLKRAAERADRDNPHALHELALIYEAQTGNERATRDEAYSLRLFHQAADLGYKFSQFRLGQAYEYGLLGCPIDARTSIAWYTKAAAQEEHQSELALSGWYLTGTSGILEQSDTEAFLWARKAACAEPPLPKALFAMGYFTEVGIGCTRSLDEAKRWYGRAAAYKFPKAQERLEELKRGGSKVQMKRERLSRTNQKQQEENCIVM
ncbi:Chitin synthase regulatory factor 3 [Pyrenophora seminiperda CCB06]|uniref:Chitin synthase regulatory factor 3 n=1 Tax=Pyrenophora seminiperda CCB06 TaxID=1302712 RepID=A0A3M7MI78_9PLEO|nr:Chitin synthase regulatory factor 3 [Pyrenophora seminiperda CCB06]